MSAKRQTEAVKVSGDWPLVPVDRLTPHPKNVRQGDIGAIIESIKANGFYRPIVVQVSTSYILAGNHAWRAAVQLGMKAVPVAWFDCSDDEALRILLVDNRTNDLASYDDAALAELLQSLPNLDGTGFDQDALDELLTNLGLNSGTAGLTDEDAVPDVPEAPISLAGDLWRLGSHVLLVGDATNAEDVARLMSGDRADLVFTDPPYNVDYSGYTDEHLKIQGDRMSEVDFKRFLEAAFQSYRTVVKPGASLYVCHASSCQREFQNALEAAGFELRCQIIWAKNTFAWGFGRYKFRHEPIFYAHLAGQSDAWYGDKSQSTLWEENKPAANRLHPTMKPVELIERALVNSSKAGDIVVDLFGGSGSTLIGCERRGRHARLTEIDPKYADVIVRRWEQYVGKQAVLDSDGRTFSEIAAERRPEAAGAAA